MFSELNDSFEDAIVVVDEGIAKFPSSVFLIICKFEICHRFRKIPEMTQALTTLEKVVDDRSYFHLSLVKCRCLLLSRKGRPEEAQRIISKELSAYPDGAVQKIRDRVLSA